MIWVFFVMAVIERDYSCSQNITSILSLQNALGAPVARFKVKTMIPTKPRYQPRYQVYLIFCHNMKLLMNRMSYLPSQNALRTKILVCLRWCYKKSLYSWPRPKVYLPYYIIFLLSLKLFTLSSIAKLFRCVFGYGG